MENGYWMGICRSAIADIGALERWKKGARLDIVDILPMVIPPLSVSGKSARTDSKESFSTSGMQRQRLQGQPFLHQRVGVVGGSVSLCSGGLTRL